MNTLSNWQDNFQCKLLPMIEAVDLIQSEDVIWAGGLLSSPIHFLLELEKRTSKLKECVLYTGLLTHPFKFLQPEYKTSLKHKSLFMGPLERKLQKSGNIEMLNFHFSQFAELFDHIKPNVTVIEMTPPNEHGYMSMGACGGIANNEAIRHSKTVIAVINKHQPFLYGKDNLIHVDDITAATEGHHPIAAPRSEEKISDLEQKIASNVLPYVNNGMTIQIGIGTISNAIGFALKDHKDLGIHTEMFTESMMDLCKSGAVNNSKKNHLPNKIVTSFTAGSQELIDFVNNNKEIEIGNVIDVVNAQEIGKNDNFISINTCVMVDVTGQVASEGVGHHQISGSGGQLDFVRGAGLSKDGISIIALSSTFKGKNGIESTIKVALPSGTPITTPRNDTQVIVTEYGSADLRGLSVPERVEALSAIAHPDFRQAIKDESLAVGLC
ncbi:4-hydroxybutyrate CoA-transferase [Vibrio sp. SS-MA-C1-2]|uniref:acetyl-CoA hydrolase/transferase family protein n=1 Tax=Vibrio sp. SS-MA-C1-2 TaxID=2908646 RepID=UPI001F1F6E43|nr:acetyl-CoA hydrolase/transferase C-terminal domain-containing protein [Vibrio sp. SS-MA-C1-2]UJF19945.1 4-hydroxybutyrate CoA-transferase [Vibrio sp. SS-MA-C1-2]